MNNSISVNQSVDSREVAKLLEKPHNDLMKSIRKYVVYIAEGNLSHGDFFIESEYLDENNQCRPSYLITKKGCEFIAHKMTGQKGTIFTAKYINLFHEMESQLMNTEPVLELEQEKISLASVNTAARLIMKTLEENHFSSTEKLVVLKVLYKQAGIEIPEKVAQIEQSTLPEPKGRVVVCEELKPMYDGLKEIYKDLSIADIDESINDIMNEPVNNRVKRKMVQMLEAVKYEH